MEAGALQESQPRFRQWGTGPRGGVQASGVRSRGLFSGFRRIARWHPGRRERESLQNCAGEGDVCGASEVEAAAERLHDNCLRKGECVCACVRL